MNNILKRSYIELAIGLIITYMTGLILTSSKNIGLLMWLSRYAIIIFILSLVITLIMSLAIKKLNPVVMKILYVIFCMMEGVSFAAVFLIYEMSSVISIFLVTALILVAMAVFVNKTDKDISGIGKFLFIGLLALFISSIINIFLKSSMLNVILSAVGAIIFAGYILYDIDKIKNTFPLLLEQGYNEKNLATFGAFNVYLDFINLFFKLLRLFGKRND